MDCKQLLACVFGLALLASLACGTKPIPTVAVAGTTITIALPRPFVTGYGTATTGTMGSLGTTGVLDLNFPYDPASTLEDPQRGEMVFELVTVPDETHVAYLPVRYISRFAPSELSPGASKPDTFSSRSGGQTLAMLDIPEDVAGPADYKIKVVRYLRDETTLVYEPQPEVLGNGVPWFGWGSGTDASGIPIRVEAGDGAKHFTPYRGWTEFNGLVYNQEADTKAALLDAIPRPYYSLVAYYEDAGTPMLSGAWEADLQYPRKRVAIRMVGLIGNRPSNALVRYQVLDSEPVDCDDGGDTGTVRIQVVDPDLETSGVRVAFELLNFGQSCGGRAIPADFVLAEGSVRVYDLDGNPQTPLILTAGIE